MRTSKVWLVNMSSSDSYTNNRHDPVGSLWQYDADGNLLMMPGTGYEYDAAGRAVTLTTATPTNLAYDGDGRQVKSAETVYDPQTETETTTTKYYVRSTVLGGKVLTEIEPESGYTRTFVYAGDAVVATQESWGSPFVSWEHRDPSNATYRTTMVGTQPGDHAELDPVGSNAGISNGASQSIPDEGSLSPYPSFGSPSQLGTTYSWDGIRMPADEFFQTVNTLLHGRFGIAQALMRGTRIHGTRTTTHTRISWHAVQDGKAFFPSGPPFFFMQSSFTEPLYGPDAMAMDVLFMEPQSHAEAERSVQIANWSRRQVEANYDRCLNRLGRVRAPGRQQTADLLWVGILEDVDFTLMAVTWGSEAIPPFGYYPNSNPRWNERTNTYDGADVGPLQVANNDVYAKAPFTSRLNNPMGTFTTERRQFDGNPWDNLRWGARAYTLDILTRARGRADAAGLFRAGTRTGPGYNDRVGQFNSQYRSYDAFFNCLRNGP